MICVGVNGSSLIIDISSDVGVSGRTIKRELEHLVEVRPTRPFRTAFEIIDYFKCEISKQLLRSLKSKQIYCTIFGAPIYHLPRFTACVPGHVPAHTAAQ